MYYVWAVTLSLFYLATHILLSRWA